jgi:excisionase family DNA binding protein
MRPLALIRRPLAGTGRPGKYILRYAFVARIGASENAPIRVRFFLDKCRSCGTMNMKKYSVSEAARILEVDRRTLQRWVNNNVIPAPTAGIVNGRLVKFWTEAEMGLLRVHKKNHYSGRGLNRRTGKKAKAST